jgi:uncharacterized membrane protein required for colicin V production
MIYKGALTGAGDQLLSLAGLFLTLFLALTYYNKLSGAIFGFQLQKWSRPVSFFVISVLALIGLRLLEKVAAGEGKDELAGIDKIGGAVVAFFRAVILFGMVGMLLILIPFEFTRTSVMEKSKTGMFLVNLDASIYSFMTGRFKITKKLTRKEVIEGLLNL